MRNLVTSLLAIAMLTVGCPESHQALAGEPEAVIIAYDGDSWNPYLLEFEKSRPAEIKRFNKVEVIQDPVQLTWNSVDQTLYFESIDGKLGRVSSQSNDVDWLRASGSPDLTQMRVLGDDLYLVELVDGKSGDTRLVKLDTASGDLSYVFPQVSSQFLPLPTDSKLYYNNVSCRLSCVPIIQDVWSFDYAAKKPKQLTMLNALTSIHSANGEHGYLVSNAKGFFNLAHLNLVSGQVSWLTDGRYTDSHPSLTKSGALYFTRRDETGTHLMVIADVNEQAALGSVQVAESVQSVELPNSIKKIRYVEGAY